VRSLEDRTLLLLVIAVSLAFAWILWPVFSAVLWATVLAIVFAPLYRRILRSMGQHPNLAALATLLIVVTLVRRLGVCPLSWVKQTSPTPAPMSAYDP
jgi:predicted PurR-regulated permease PerM